MAQAPSTGSDDPVDITNIEDVCTAWAQKKYGPKCKVVSVDTKDLTVVESNMKYCEEDKEESSSPPRRNPKSFVNRSNVPAEQEFSNQCAQNYTCVWTKTKGVQVSGGMSVTVGLPNSVGLSFKIEARVQLSDTSTEKTGVDETTAQVTKFTQPPRSTLLTETVTTQKVVTMPYTLDFRLGGKLSITLQKANGKLKTKSVDVVDLYPDGEGKKSVLLTTEGTFKTSIEVHQVVEMKEQDAEEVMKLIHKDLLNDKREKIVEQVSDKQALPKLLEAMSAEKGISEEQFNFISQKSSVKEGVDELVDVLKKAEPEKFLLFVDILRREGYGELVELLDPTGKYPDSVKQISNLSRVVDHYFVTKKDSEVRNSLESARGAIIHGMPGSGKTQLAYKVAGDYARVHPHSVVWVIDGSSEVKINDGIANLQQRLSEDTNVDNSLFQSVVSRWKHFLLLINDLSPTVAIPTQVLSSSAKLIVTTQDSLIHLDNVANISIEGFTEDEVVEFLSPQMPPGTSTEQMRDLANIFSCLPLGLAAARASIHRGKMTVEEYKRQLQGGREALEALMNREDDWLKRHYKKEHQKAARNIFAALQLAIDKLDDPCKPGEEKKYKAMLQPCAFLHPNNIPILILKSALKSSPTIGSDAHFTERMRMYSLGSIEGEGVKRRLSIHSVTQLAIRLHMDKQQQTTCINKLLQILVKFFLKDMTYSETHKFSLKLMPHVEAVLKHAEELDLGPEYPLMKARLLMVYGHLLIQKGTSDLSIKHLEKAKESLLRFAGFLSTQSVDKNRDYHTTSKDLYQSLARKSQSLEDSFFEETVIRRAIKKQILRAVSDKLGAEDSTTRKLESMMENFEPLTMEMYNTLVYSYLAIPVEKLKIIFLPEMYISIMFTLGKALFDLGDGYSTCRSLRSVSWDRLITLALDMCTEVTNETEVLVMGHFLSDFVSLSRVKVTDMVISGVKDIVESVLFKAVETLILHKKIRIYAETRSYDFGLLTGGGDTLLKLNYYENVMVFCIQAVQQAKEGEKDGLISWGQETCEEMLKLVECINSKAGNPPLGLSEYYRTAGLFNLVVEELEKAAKMFWKAYKVELEREEYHPRMADALGCLIQVLIAQNELRSAREYARRHLQLAKKHWPEQVQLAEEELRKVCNMIGTETEQAKATCEKVPTV